MEIVLLILMYIEHGLKFVVKTLYFNLYDYLMATLSIVILLDDLDVIKAIKNV